MVSVTSASCNVTSASLYQSRPSMYILGLIPRNSLKQFSIYIWGLIRRNSPRQFRLASLLSGPLLFYRIDKMSNPIVYFHLLSCLQPECTSALYQWLNISQTLQSCPLYLSRRQKFRILAIRLSIRQMYQSIAVTHVHAYILETSFISLKQKIEWLIGTAVGRYVERDAKTSA